MRRGDLTDEQWARLGPLLLPHKRKTGRPNKDHHRIVNGLLWIDRTGAPWRDLPERYAHGGQWQAASIAGAKQEFGTECCKRCVGELMRLASSMDEALAELGETRETAERELTALRGRRERLEELERDKEALLHFYAGLAPEALESLAPEERHRVYRMLGVRGVAHVGGTLEVGGALAGPIGVSKGETACSWGFSILVCGGRG